MDTIQAIHTATGNGCCSLFDETLGSSTTIPRDSMSTRRNPFSAEERFAVSGVEWLGDETTPHCTGDDVAHPNDCLNLEAGHLASDHVPDMSLPDRDRNAIRDSAR